MSESQLIQLAGDDVRALLDSDFDPRVVMRPVRDTDGRICDFVYADVNQAAATHNGLTPPETIGRQMLVLFPDLRRSDLFAMYCRAMETNETLELRDFRYAQSLDGGIRSYIVRALPLGDHLHCTWRDVTNQTPGAERPPAAASPPHPAALERRRKRDISAEAQSQLREFQALAQKLIEQREQQQQVISRELHDNIAQVLSAAATRISLAKDEPIPAWLRQELVDLRDQLKVALEDVRHLARDLRPSLLDHCGFAAALDKHAEAFRERNTISLDVRVDAEAVSFLGSENLTHLFRLTQEALHNIEDHSKANRAWIALWHVDGAIQLEIGDDGCAFTPERVAEAQADGHLGLLGMRERAELLGGDFVLEAVPSQGTVIKVTIPPPPQNPTLNSTHENDLSPHH